MQAAGASTHSRAGPFSGQPRWRWAAPARRPFPRYPVCFLSRPFSFGMSENKPLVGNSGARQTRNRDKTALTSPGLGCPIHMTGRAAARVSEQRNTPSYALCCATHPYQYIPPFPAIMFLPFLYIVVCLGSARRTRQRAPPPRPAWTSQPTPAWPGRLTNLVQHPARWARSRGHSSCASQLVCFQTHLHSFLDLYFSSSLDFFSLLLKRCQPCRTTACPADRPRCPKDGIYEAQNGFPCISRISRY